MIPNGMNFILYVFERYIINKNTKVTEMWKYGHLNFPD